MLVASAQAIFTWVYNVLKLLTQALTAKFFDNIFSLLVKANKKYSQHANYSGVHS